MRNLALLLFVLPAAALGQDFCTGLSREVPVDRTVASTSPLSNFMRFPGSVLHESYRLVNAAIEQENSPPRGICPESCAVATNPLFVFRSAPAKLIHNYSDAATCAKLEVETSSNPIQYKDRCLPDVDGVVDYVSSLLRGKGRDGEDLYQRCPGNCAPRLVAYVRHSESGLVVDSHVVCGHASDRRENAYDLSINLKWSCRSSEAARGAAGEVFENSMVSGALLSSNNPFYE